MSPSARTSESGFSLPELLVAMLVMLVVLAGTMQILTTALKSESAAKEALDMNANLRSAMDLMQRDLLQVGQGLPVGRRIGVPHGAGAALIRRPGPAASGGCAGVTTFPDDSTIPAVSVGAGIGPAANGECTDVITILAADNVFGPVSLASIAANGGSAVVYNRDQTGAVLNISDNPDANGDNVRAGDLFMLTKGATSVLVQVTSVAANTVTFGTGGADPLRLNQLDPALTVAGTVNQLKAQAPVDPNVPVVNGAGVQQAGPTQVARIRMITYYVDSTIDPVSPRLMRVVNGGTPNVVAFGVHGLRYSYDIVDQINNPADVRMDASDLAGGGACTPSPCSVNQIRKINVLLSMNATLGGNPDAAATQQSQNTLYSQVSLRGMAFVDRYR